MDEDGGFTVKKTLSFAAAVLVLVGGALWIHACGNAASQDGANTANKATNAPTNEAAQPKPDKPTEAPKADKPAADLPKGELTDEGLVFKVSFERGEGYARFARQNEMLRLDVDVRLPYSGGDGQNSPGSGLDLVLSVDGLHGRHLFFYPNRLWLPTGNGNLAAYRMELSWDRDQPTPTRLQGQPSFVGKSNVRFWDHWTATVWVDLRYVLVPGNSPTSLSDEWFFGLVMGNEAATLVYPSGLDVQNPGQAPDRLLGLKLSELPALENEDENPRDELIAAEEANLEVMRGVDARCTVRDFPGAYKKIVAALEADPDQLWAHNLGYIIAYTYYMRGQPGVDADHLKLQRAYIDASPGQSSVHLEYLKNLLPIGRFDEAMAHAATVFESALCTGRAATDGYMRLKWSEALIPWGHIDEVKKQFAYLDARPELQKENGFRIDYQFQQAELAIRQGDSKRAVEIYQALIKADRSHLNKQQFDMIQQTLQFQRQAAEQWEEELTYQAEDAKKANPRLVIETDKGKIVVELFEDDAPNTTASMVSLAQKKFYDGLNFHRVEPNFVAQGGCPKGNGTGSPGYLLKREISRRNHFRGTVAMARSEAPDSAGSQFYICVANSNNVLNLSGKYAVIGRVIEGMEVADMLRAGDKIKSVTAENLRDHEYKPQTLPE
jgi:peptidyl-prolyl cis-trans isomerase B (cyclophilin B)